MSQLEYRLNYFTDAIVQPAVTSLIEITLWFALFKSVGAPTVNGYKLEAYLAYAIWGAFVTRITSTWMYEFRMADEIESGSINAILVRPFSFFEYYMSQFFGYKVITTAVSMTIPLFVSWYFNLEVIWSRVGPAFLLIFYYLFLVQTLSFIVATVAFHLNRTQSFTVAKNLGLWLLSGELIPLDLFPDWIYRTLTFLPFSCGVYIPVGYLTGRVSPEMFYHGFVSTTVGLIFFGWLARWSWKFGLSVYAGTGA